MSENTPPQTKVTFVSDYTSGDGKSFYEGGETYPVDAPDARLYVNLGKARLADDGTRAHREPESTKKPRASRAKSKPAPAPAANATTGAIATPPAPDTSKAGN